MSIRKDLVRDLRETVLYRLSFHDHAVDTTINCSSLSGNSASLGVPRLELLNVKSNVDRHIGIFNLTPNNTESLSFAVGIGDTDISFSEPVQDMSSSYSSVVKIEAHGGNASGYILLTFAKKGGFENIGNARRKPLRRAPYGG